MTYQKVGWTMLISGGVLQVLEGFAHADATLNNVEYNQTAVGKLVAPVETMLPISLGWTLIVIGASLVRVLPRIA